MCCSSPRFTALYFHSEGSITRSRGSVSREYWWHARERYMVMTWHAVIHDTEWHNYYLVVVVVFISNITVSSFSPASGSLMLKQLTFTICFSFKEFVFQWYHSHSQHQMSQCIWQNLTSNSVKQYRCQCHTHTHSLLVPDFFFHIV